MASAPAREYDSALLIASFIFFPSIKLSILAIIKKSSEILDSFAFIIFLQKIFYTVLFLLQFDL